MSVKVKNTLEKVHHGSYKSEECSQNPKNTKEDRKEKTIDKCSSVREQRFTQEDHQQSSSTRS